MSGTINGKPLPDRLFAQAREGASNFFILKHHRSPTADDEQEIRDDEQEISALMQQTQCDGIKQAIRAAAHEAVKQQLGITVTSEDLIAAREAYPMKRANTLVDNAPLILNSLSAVYDRHEDPNQVYAQNLQNKIQKDL